MVVNGMIASFLLADLVLVGLWGFFVCPRYLTIGHKHTFSRSLFCMGKVI